MGRIKLNGTEYLILAKNGYWCGEMIAAYIDKVSRKAVTICVARTTEELIKWMQANADYVKELTERKLAA